MFTNAILMTVLFGNFAAAAALPFISLLQFKPRHAQPASVAALSNAAPRQETRQGVNRRALHKSGRKRPAIRAANSISARRYHRTSGKSQEAAR
jgi:hypothetical protein